MGGVTLDNDEAWESSLGDILRYFTCIAGVSNEGKLARGLGNWFFFFFFFLLFFFFLFIIN